MEIHVIEVSGVHFIVHLEQSALFNMSFSGSVYWGQEFMDNDGTHIGYESEDNSGNAPHKEFNEDCRKAFDFSFVWRGVWEDRVYMRNDEELWYGELREISTAWDQIEIYLKERIKSENPDYGCFDD